MPGGLFGRQPANYGQVVSQEPSEHRMSPGGGDGLDFLSRVEQAEARDSRRLGAGPSSVVFGDDSTSGAYDVSRQNRQVTQQRRQQQWQGGIVFGDDSSAASRQHQPSMYQTTNASNQAKMQQQHRAALKKQEEKVLVDIMVEQHGMTPQEARQELELYRQEQANGLVDDASAYEQVQAANEREQARASNDPWDVQDPFKQRSPTYSAPKTKKPWDVNDAFKQGHDRSPPRPKSKPWEIDDPFKQRSGSTPSKSHQQAWDVVDPLRGSHQSPPAREQHGMMQAAGAMSDGAHAGVARRGHSHQWNANRPSMEGGLFSQGAYAQESW